MNKTEKKNSSLTNLAIKTAIKAGKIILDVYHSPNDDFELKDDNSPLTIADKRAHNVIVEELRSTGIPILSEEGKAISYEERKKWEFFWLADPLDGTKEFLKKNDEFTVNIALIKDNTPVAGIIYVPVSKQLYWGDKNGSFKAVVNEEEETYSQIQKLPLVQAREDYIVVGSRSHMSSETEAFIGAIDAKGRSVQIRSKGSSLKICMVAEGDADIYPRLAPTMEWDTAAGHAIALFAGKKIVQYNSNNPLVYNKQNLVNPWFVVE